MRQFEDDMWPIYPSGGHYGSGCSLYSVETGMPTYLQPGRVRWRTCVPLLHAGLHLQLLVAPTSPMGRASAGMQVHEQDTRYTPRHCSCRQVLIRVSLVAAR